MAKNKTAASTYKSRYAVDSWIRPDQYIAELMCERRATQLKRELPFEFWKLPEWSGFFRRQIQLAAPLIREYGHSVVIKVLNQPEYKWIGSLNNPQLQQAICDYHAIARQGVHDETLNSQTYQRPDFNPHINRLSNLD